MVEKVVLRSERMGLCVCCTPLKKVLRLVIVKGSEGQMGGTCFCARS